MENYVPSGVAGPIYVVKDEHTLGYLDGNSSLMSILAGSVIKGGHDWKNGPVAIVPGCTKLRRATVADFEAFRVQMPPDFDACQLNAPMSIR